MGQATKQRRNYSSMTMEDAMTFIGAENLSPWQLDAPPRNQSDTLKEILRRLESFDLQASESAKTMLIDALFVEIVPLHPKLKVWKETVLNTDSTTGVADYVIAPKRAYLATPLLCVAEAKKDDFAKGRIQCLAEMAACRWSNEQRGQLLDMYGIVSNGQAWQFYKLTVLREVFETGVYGIEDMPAVLGALDYVCEECAKNAP